MEKEPALQWESLEEALWFKALVSGGTGFAQLILICLLTFLRVLSSFCF